MSKKKQKQMPENGKTTKAETCNGNLNNNNNKRNKELNKSKRKKHKEQIERETKLNAPLSSCCT